MEESAQEADERQWRQLIEELHFHIRRADEAEAMFKKAFYETSAKEAWVTPEDFWDYLVTNVKNPPQAMGL